MKKLPKRPRIFGRTKYKAHKNKQKQQRRFSNARISKIFDDMINSPIRMWHINYDEYGKYVSVALD